MEERTPVALPLGAATPLGAGTYTEIVGIDAPSNAEAGTTVNIIVRIKNTYSSLIGIMAGGALEYGVTPWPTIKFSDSTKNVNPGSIASFSGSFVMPSYPPGKEIIIHAYSYYYTAQGWYFDDEFTRTIVVGGAAEAEFQSLSVSYAKA